SLLDQYAHPPLDRLEAGDGERMGDDQAVLHPWTGRDVLLDVADDILFLFEEPEQATLGEDDATARAEWLIVHDRQSPGDGGNSIDRQDQRPSRFESFLEGSQGRTRIVDPCQESGHDDRLEAPDFRSIGARVGFASTGIEVEADPPSLDHNRPGA